MKTFCGFAASVLLAACGSSHGATSGGISNGTGGEPSDASNGGGGGTHFPSNSGGADTTFPSNGGETDGAGGDYVGIVQTGGTSGTTPDAGTGLVGPGYLYAYQDTDINNPRNPILLSDGYIYVSVTNPPPMYSTTSTYSVIRFPKDGGFPETVVTAPESIWLVAGDADSDYFIEADSWAWSQSIQRMAIGESTLTTVATSHDVNGFYASLARTSDWLFLSLEDSSYPGSSTVQGIPMTASGTAWDRSVSGQVLWARSDGTNAVTVVESTTSGSGFQALEVTPSSASTIGPFPDQCVYVIPSPVDSGWIAFCGTTAPYDVVKLTPDRNVDTVLLKASAQDYSHPLTFGTRVYWFNAYDTTDALAFYDLADGTTANVSIGTQSVFAVDDSYAYLSASDGIRRRPLPAAHAPQ
jgi:hypothetical protein